MKAREIVIPSQFILPNAPREGIVINAAAMRLFYYPKVKKGEPQVVHTYPIGIGKVGWKTPEGATKIVRRQKDPTWRPTASIIKEHREERGEKLDAVVGPGPDNPLGRYAFYLGWPTYMIHGTNKPAGVGLRSSHGCIRLYPEDIAQLFELAPIGTQVRVVNQPFVFGWHDGALHIQAFDVLEDDPRDWKKAQAKLLNKALAERIQKELAGAQGKDRLGCGRETRARAARHAGVGVRRPRPARSHRRHARRSCRTRLRRAPRGMASPTCRWTRRRSRSSSSDRESSVESAAAAAAPALRQRSPRQLMGHSPVPTNAFAEHQATGRRRFDGVEWPSPANCRR